MGGAAVVHFIEDRSENQFRTINRKHLLGINKVRNNYISALIFHGNMPETRNNLIM